MLHPLLSGRSGILQWSQGRVWSGNAKGIDESNNAYDLGDIYNTLFVGNSECPSATIAAISDDISTARNVANLIAGQPSGLPLGINQTIQGRQFTLGIKYGHALCGGHAISCGRLVDQCSR